jgi:cobalt-zinc-cadmium efflux system membrane fusion protein
MTCTRTVRLVCCTLALLWGCREGEHHPEHTEPGEGAQHEKEARDEHEHDEGANTLHVNPTMLRDLHLTTGVAEARAAGDVITVLGELRVNEERYAEVSTPVPARVARVLAAEGDVVTVGQPLVELESVDVGKARAELASIRARTTLLRSTVERKRALVAEQLAAVRERESAEAELEQAEAELRGAEQLLSALGSGQGQGSRFTLRAPLSGTVLERHVLPGRRVDDHAPLFVLSDVSSLWLVVHAFERDALRVKQSSSARVSFAALPERTVEGRVARVGTRVDPISRTVDVRIDVANAEGLLRPGMSATARIALGDATSRLIAVPTQAVQRVDRGWAVFVPEKEQGGFEVRPVGRGRDLDGEVEILSGLSAGETVVIDGAFLLKAQLDKARGGGAEHHH